MIVYKSSKEVAMPGMKMGRWCYERMCTRACVRASAAPYGDGLGNDLGCGKMTEKTQR